LLASFVIPTLGFFASYYTDYHKAPDWFPLRDFLRVNTKTGDTVIMTSLDPTTGYTDPGFGYYYSGTAQVIALPHPNFDTAQVVKKALDQSRAVWFILAGESTASVENALSADGQLIGEWATGRSFSVHEYRAKQAKTTETDASLDLAVGEGHLSGYAIDGEKRSGSVLNVLLYWDHMPKDGLKVFVHLIGAVKSDGSPLWTQDDHPPQLTGGDLGRDVYHLDLATVPPGDYAIEIGLYDPNTLQRLPILDKSSGHTVGDSYLIAHIKIDPAH
jgi:hypothetical protein